MIITLRVSHSEAPKKVPWQWQNSWHHQKWHQIIQKVSPKQESKKTKK